MSEVRNAGIVNAIQGASANVVGTVLCQMFLASDKNNNFCTSSLFCFHLHLPSLLSILDVPQIFTLPF